MVQGGVGMGGGQAGQVRSLELHGKPLQDRAQESRVTTSGGGMKERQGGDIVQTTQDGGASAAVAVASPC